MQESSSISQTNMPSPIFLEAHSPLTSLLLSRLFQRNRYRKLVVYFNIDSGVGVTLKATDSVGEVLRGCAWFEKGKPLTPSRGVGSVLPELPIFQEKPEN